MRRGPEDSPRVLYASLRALLEDEYAAGLNFAPKTDALQPATIAPAAASEPEPAAVANVRLDFPSTGSSAERLSAIAERIATCRRCGLCEGRTHTVPGEGDPAAELLFIGEGPGADEDRSGRPFVGAAGQLLDRMIRAMGLAREQVFIANIVKCRPPGNRTPEPDEAAACFPYLEAQVAAIVPKVICTLGNTPLRALSGNQRAGITRMRGTPFEWNGIPVVPTYHPSYLLRNESAKKPAWEDLKTVLGLLGRELPQRS